LYYLLFIKLIIATIKRGAGNMMYYELKRIYLYKIEGKRKEKHILTKVGKELIKAKGDHITQNDLEKIWSNIEYSEFWAGSYRYKRGL
jgi:hypothetical protein